MGHLLKDAWSDSKVDLIKIYVCVIPSHHHSWRKHSLAAIKCLFRCILCMWHWFKKCSQSWAVFKRSENHPAESEFQFFAHLLWMPFHCARLYISLQSCNSTHYIVITSNLISNHAAWSLSFNSCIQLSSITIWFIVLLTLWPQHIYRGAAEHRKWQQQHGVPQLEVFWVLGWCPKFTATAQEQQLQWPCPSLFSPARSALAEALSLLPSCLHLWAVSKPYPLTVICCTVGQDIALGGGLFLITTNSLLKISYFSKCYGRNFQWHIMSDFTYTCSWLLCSLSHGNGDLL